MGSGTRPVQTKLLKSKDVPSIRETRAEYFVPKPDTLQIILDLCIPENELAKTYSQISFLYFQSHS